MSKAHGKAVGVVIRVAVYRGHERPTSEAEHRAMVQELLDIPDVQRIETHPATKQLVWITYLGLQPANEIAEQCALVVSKHAVKGE